MVCHAEEPVRVPSANVTVVDPREEGKLAEEIQKNLIREMEKEQEDRRAGRTAREQEEQPEQPQEQTKQTQEQPEQSEEQPERKAGRPAPNKNKDTCTERTRTTGRAEAGRSSRLPGRKYHG